MGRHLKVRAALFSGCLAVLVIVSLAAAQSAPMIGSGDVVADRKRLMRLNGASLEDLEAKAKAGNIEAIAVNAETIALNALHIPFLFPTGSASDKSRSRPDIWQKPAEFENAAKNLQALAEKLRDAARAKDAATVQAMVKDFGKQGCGKCHVPSAGGTLFGPRFRSFE
jgi:cytochrome c556